MLPLVLLSSGRSRYLTDCSPFCMWSFVCVKCYVLHSLSAFVRSRVLPLISQNIINIVEQLCPGIDSAVCGMANSMQRVCFCVIVNAYTICDAVERGMRCGRDILVHKLYAMWYKILFRCKCGREGEVSWLLTCSTS